MTFLELHLQKQGSLEPSPNILDIGDGLASLRLMIHIALLEAKRRDRRQAPQPIVQRCGRHFHGGNCARHARLLVSGHCAALVCQGALCHDRQRCAADACAKPTSCCTIRACASYLAWSETYAQKLNLGGNCFGD